MILVTGGTGLVGSFAVQELERRGHAVRVLRRPEGDLGNPESLTRAARDVDGIVHAACTVTTPAVDVTAMETLLANWQRGPFVFISTLDVYGYAGPGPITEETQPGEPLNAYSRGKIACEGLLIEAAARAGRTDYVILRAPYIWGPHPTARKRLLGRRLEAGLPIVLPGTSPEEWMDYRDAWIDVRDFATIVAECTMRPTGGPLNVLAGHFAWHDLHMELIALTGSRSRVVHKPLEEITDEELPDKRLYAQTWRFGAERLERHLGTIPRRPFETTVGETILGVPNNPK
ncbi:NAD(P)-dependent oxidoreductase [Pendulispora brunnea]|uniref:NAD(P)-dependent oxidoreductase n=1 Tax=Pendulispora brunnea TaxID=2905690 RepID=A0ABZ2KDL2_9BACT